MQYEHIDDHDQLVDFCSAAQDEPFLGFDTEFVSEDTYRPQLCLVQVTAGERLAVIDPLSIDEMTTEMYSHQEGFYYMLAVTDVGARMEFLDQRGHLAIANPDEVERDGQRVYRYRLA